MSRSVVARLSGYLSVCVSMRFLCLLVLGKHHQIMFDSLKKAKCNRSGGVVFTVELACNGLFRSVAKSISPKCANLQ